MDSYTQSIILFDGVCNLCNGFVQFILTREKTDRLIFTSLQSDKGMALLKEYHLPLEETPSSIVFIEEGKAYTQSTAILKIARHLKGIWCLAPYLLIIPKPIRDLVYELIGKNRYRLFGKSTTCWLPTPEFKKRFLV